MEKFSVIYYTNGNISLPILNANLYSILQQITPSQLTIVTHRKLEHPLLSGVTQLIYSPVGRYNVDIYCQALAAVEMSAHETIMIAEHDVLYPHDHFASCLRNHVPGQVNYATNVYMLNALGYWTYRPMRIQSMAFGTKRALYRALETKMQAINWGMNKADAIFDVGVRDGTHTPTFWNPHEVIDVRHGANATQTGTQRKEQTIIESVPYWGEAKYLIERLELVYDHGLKHTANPPAN